MEEINNKFGLRINKFCSVENYKKCKKLKTSYNEIIENLCFENYKGKLINYTFYRNIFLGGYYLKCFKYNDIKLSFIELYVEVIINGESEYFNSKEFEEDITLLLLNCIKENIIKVTIDDTLINKIRCDILECWCRENNRSKSIHESLVINYDEELWVKVLKDKNNLHNNMEYYNYDLFVEELLSWGIINKLSQKLVLDVTDKYL